MERPELKFDFPKGRPSIIKVIGVGGGGGNAVTHMYNAGIRDVEFVLCNTDYQAMIKSEVPVKMQLGRSITEGLGAGNKPEVAKKAAQESINDIQRLLGNDTKMVFITAGMGGGTGTGAAPIVAKAAKDLDILTVGIVTIPFLFEGRPKILKALYGVEEMNKSVDALLVINNERLRDIYSDLTMLNAFKKADDTLAIAAKSIAEIITIPGHVNLDFADVNTTLRDGGVAIMSSGQASGEERVTKAIHNALHSPLLNNNDIFKAQKILLNISFSEQVPLEMPEMNEINDFMVRFGSNIDVIWGAAVENELEENVKVTILATGFRIEHVPGMPEKLAIDNKEDLEELQKKEREEAEKRMEEERMMRERYGDDSDKVGKRTRPKPFIFSLDQLDDNDIIDAVISHPTYNRQQSEFEKLINE
jgi:cell division protein FtsZ